MSLIVFAGAVAGVLSPALTRAQGFASDKSFTTTATHDSGPEFPIYEARIALTVTDSAQSGLSERLRTAITELLADQMNKTMVDSAAELSIAVKIDLFSCSVAKHTKANYHEPCRLWVSLSAADAKGDMVDHDSFYTNSQAPQQKEDIQTAVSLLLDEFRKELSERWMAVKHSSYELALPIGVFQNASLLGMSHDWQGMLDSFIKLGNQGTALEPYRLYGIAVARKQLSYEEADRKVAARDSDEAAFLLRSCYELDVPIPNDSRHSFELSFLAARSFTDQNILELTRYGTSDELISKLIRGHSFSPRFNLSETSIQYMKSQGVSTGVLEEMSESEKNYESKLSKTLKYRSSGNLLGMTGLPHAAELSGEPPAPLASNATDFPRFPWPPPTATSKDVLPLASIEERAQIKTYGDVDSLLQQALQKSGYADHSYFSVPGGFAVATRFEQVDATGVPLHLPDRWIMGKVQLKEISLRSWARALFSSQAGYYRVIVFVVSDKSFGQSRDAVDDMTAKSWVSVGANVLETSLSKRSVTVATNCTALIYEFRRLQNSSTFLQENVTDARTQLKNAGLWAAMQLP